MITYLSLLLFIYFHISPPPFFFVSRFLHFQFWRQLILFLWLSAIFFRYFIVKVWRFLNPFNFILELNFIFFRLLAFLIKLCCFYVFFCKEILWNVLLMKHLMKVTYKYFSYIWENYKISTYSLFPVVLTKEWNSVGISSYLSNKWQVLSCKKSTDGEKEKYSQWRKIFNFYGLSLFI